MISASLTLWLVAAGAMALGWVLCALGESRRTAHLTQHINQRLHRAYWQGFHDRVEQERRNCHPLRHAICPDRVYSVQGLIDAASSSRDASRRAPAEGQS